MNSTHPFKLADEALRRGGFNGSLSALLGHYIRTGGYVWSSPTEFILACPVRIDAATGTMTHTDDNPDTWFVHVAASGIGGAVRRFLSLAPYTLPFVAWHRGAKGDSRLRRYPWRSVAKHCNLEAKA